MSFCMYCGTQLPDGANVCPQCGQWVALNQPAGQQDNPCQQIPAENVLSTEGVAPAVEEIIPETTAEPIFAETAAPMMQETAEPVIAAAEPVITEATEPVIAAATESVISTATEPAMPEEIPNPEIPATAEIPLMEEPVFIPVPPVMPSEPVMQPNPMMNNGPMMQGMPMPNGPMIQGMPMPNGPMNNGFASPIQPAGMPNLFGTNPENITGFSWKSIPNRFSKDFRKCWWLTLLLILTYVAESLLFNYGTENSFLMTNFFPLKDFIINQRMVYFDFILIIVCAIGFASWLIMVAHADPTYSIVNIFIVYVLNLILNICMKNDCYLPYNRILIFLAVFLFCHIAATRRSMGAAITLRFLVPLVALPILYMTRYYGTLSSVLSEDFAYFVRNIPSVFKNYGFEMIFTAGFVILFNLIMLPFSIKEGRYWKQVAEHENLL